MRSQTEIRLGAPGTRLAYNAVSAPEHGTQNLELGVGQVGKLAGLPSKYSFLRNGRSDCNINILWSISILHSLCLLCIRNNVVSIRLDFYYKLYRREMQTDQHADK